MFTGIIETIGAVKEIISSGSNKSFWIESPLSHEFKIDQSINHNGVCLTVEDVRGSSHKITAIEETLAKTNLNTWKIGQLINLERCVPVTGRLDGHIVQGHVDTTAMCLKRKSKNGSWEFEFELPEKFSAFIVEKDSICINGISLTAYKVKRKSFRVAIIPYTFDHTGIREILVGNNVNLEFNIIGKYIHRYLTLNKMGNNKPG